MDATKRNESKALQVELEARQAILEGRNPPQRIVVRKFKDAAYDFLESVRIECHSHPNTYRRIATSFASAKDFFGEKLVGHIDDDLLEDFKIHRMTKHQVRDITLRHDLHALSRFFKYAIRKHWARENPIQRVTIPSDAEAIRIHVVTDEEAKQYFVRAANSRDLNDVARLMLNQGMRPDELTSLAKEDVDLETGRVFIRRGKTPAARRVLDLTTESRGILGGRRKGISRWIFPSKRNPGQHIGRLNGAHDRVCARAAKDGVSLNFVLYDFRHTFATRLAQAGVDLATVAALLGHKTVRIVERYVHPTADHKRSAMMRYDQLLRALEFDGEGPESRPN